MEKDDNQNKQEVIGKGLANGDHLRSKKVSFGEGQAKKNEVQRVQSQSSSNTSDSEEQEHQTKPIPLSNLHPLLPIPSPTGRGKSIGPRKSIWQDQLKKRMSYLPSQQLYRYGVSFSQHRQPKQQIAFLSRARQKMMKAEVNLTDIIGQAVTSNPSVEQPISVRLVPQVQQPSRKQPYTMTATDNFWKANQSNTAHTNMAQFSMTSSQNNSFFTRQSPKVSPLSSLHCTNTSNFNDPKLKKNGSFIKKIMNFNFRKVENQMEKNVKRVLPTFPISKISHATRQNDENSVMEIDKPLLTQEAKTCSSTVPTSCNSSGHFKPQPLPTDILKNIKAAFISKKKVDDCRLATIYRDWSYQPSSNDDRTQSSVPLYRLQKSNKSKPRPTLMERNIQQIQNRCHLTRYQIYEMFSIFNTLKKDTQNSERYKKQIKKCPKKWQAYKKSLSIMIDVYPEIVDKTANRMLTYGDPLTWLQSFQNFLHFIREIRKDSQQFKLTELTEVLNLQKLQLPDNLYSWKQGRV